MVAIALGVVCAAGASTALSRQASPFHNLGIFARVLSQIEKNHIEDVDQDKLIYSAIRGMMLALDPHSAFMDPEEYRILANDTQGRFGGVGVEISVQDGWLTVLSTFEGAPAAQAGIRPGDRFVVIDGHDARDMRIEDAIRRMRGEPGTQVQVRVRRESSQQLLDFVITRQIIRVRAVEGKILPEGIVYLRVKAFQENTTSELRRALDSAIETISESHAKVSGVLLDLRDNAGGLLDEAVLMADEFLPEGVIVSTRGRGGKLLSEDKATRRGTRPNWPMVVLVNGFTASAAEIVAGALHDHHRAIVVGTRTFGKGSVQNIIELPDGSALKLTIARYYTPSGRSIQAEGIEPDMLVEQLDPELVDQANAKQQQIREESLERHLSGKAELRPLPSKVAPRDSARTGPDSEALDSPPFARDFQAHMAHQALRAIIATREKSGAR